MKELGVLQNILARYELRAFARKTMAELYFAIRRLWGFLHRVPVGYE